MLFPLPSCPLQVSYGVNGAALLRMGAAAVGAVVVGVALAMLA